MNGNKYEGEWKNNLKNGKGVLYFLNGDVFIGHFLYDKYNYFGIFSWKDGNKYAGNWKEN